MSTFSAMPKNSHDRRGQAEFRENSASWRRQLWGSHACPSTAQRLAAFAADDVPGPGGRTRFGWRQDSSRRCPLQAAAAVTLRRATRRSRPSLPDGRSDLRSASRPARRLPPARGQQSSSFSEASTSCFADPRTATTESATPAPKRGNLTPLSLAASLLSLPAAAATLLWK
jgi:hypothetical protein